MTTTLDITTLPCPEGWTWERPVRIAVLCSPGAPDGRWSAAVSPDRGGWLALVAPDAPTDLNYRYLSSLYPTPIDAARAALLSLALAGHPEAAALRAAAGEPPRRPTHEWEAVIGDDERATWGSGATAEAAALSAATTFWEDDISGWPDDAGRYEATAYRDAVWEDRDGGEYSVVVASAEQVEIVVEIGEDGSVAVVP